MNLNFTFSPSASFFFLLETISVSAVNPRETPYENTCSRFGRVSTYSGWDNGISYQSMCNKVAFLYVFSSYVFPLKINGMQIK